MRIRRAERARWRQVPAGMRDQTAAEVAARRRAEERLRETFARWGYHEVATPAVEFYETFLHGAGPGVGDRLLKLVDADGEVLALRPEMTVPLARLAATRLLPGGEGPLRLAYVAPVFRGQERGSGRHREFTQAGVELIGAAGWRGDAEVIALAADALRAVGLTDAAISVGHAGFLRGLLATLPDGAAETARELLYRRAFAELEAAVPPGPALEALRSLPVLRGPTALARAELLAHAAESREALAALAAVLEGVEAHAPSVRVEVDLGLIRDFDYYSGIVFEAHGPAAGLPLLGGGRYDDLLARFGHPAPATGFAIGVDRVLDVLDCAPASRPTVAVRYEDQAYRQAVRVALVLRRAGLAVVALPDGAAGPLAACTVRVGPDTTVVSGAAGEVATAFDDVLVVVRAALETRA
ncbi:MAG: ATP phosphoribosyltransferase regulatory subunit [Armatimonadota bacterium]|nr:ATP phosphoribosyltransferase regulatory subunit [Armatimonadota bacterium]MDR7456640.1 ATP phosphoribosyltransferase regulatory subunit [Armatimonadota bacterium]MDR7495550.1 ATP phosphoribosyltransferase regulatory subunit [Armatimonadota bacterium]MDR7510719.1 ATP phosphoribosyltransferase regulatory subunit [Armatimonadota bacterium]